ncbi:MAG: hypothetical protein D6735_04190 [Acidobacteria bacterium]|jgi:tetratricopeptide (TPR) repeat protein|nr:MAG: hypothetical protein D6735_04190 [Acidobacteriota bacterium]
MFQYVIPSQTYPNSFFILTLFILLPTIPRLYGLILLQRNAEYLNREDIDPHQLAQITDNLELSARLLPNDPTPLRYLAKVYQKRGMLASAIIALEKAYEAEPNSLLIGQELFLAYRSIRKPTIWLEERLKYSPEDGIRAGDACFFNGDYQRSLLWYNWVLERWPSYQDQVSFRRLIAATLIDDKYLPEILQQSQEDISVKRDKPTIIPGSELRWVDDIEWPGITLGTKLSFPYDNYDEGIFWWSGRASIVVAPEEDDLYVVVLTTRNSFPPPVHLAIGTNGRPLQYVLLNEGDNAWSTVTVIINLHQPATTLDVWFLNNGSVDGHDRDAVIRQIVISDY